VREIDILLCVSAHGISTQEESMFYRNEKEQQNLSDRRRLKKDERAVSMTLHRSSVHWISFSEVSLYALLLMEMATTTGHIWNFSCGEQDLFGPSIKLCYFS